VKVTSVFHNAVSVRKFRWWHFHINSLLIAVGLLIQRFWFSDLNYLTINLGALSSALPANVAVNSQITSTHISVYPYILRCNDEIVNDSAAVLLSFCALQTSHQSGVCNCRILPLILRTNNDYFAK